MRSRTPIRALTSALVAGALALALLAPGAQAATRHIDGTVLSKDASTRTFRLATQSGTLRVKVNAGTDFERIAGFGGLHKGLAVEVDAVRTANGLLATQVETRGGGGGGGDDHGGSGGGSDDGPNHT
jgi:hypothetical protein